MPRASKPSLYSKEHLARLMAVTQPEDFRALLCNGTEQKFWRDAIWELVMWFYGDMDLPIPLEYFTDDLVLLPFIDFCENLGCTEPRFQFIQTTCYLFYMSFMPLVRAVVEWHDLARADNPTLVLDMPHSELPALLVIDFQSAVICRSTWMEIIERCDNKELCIWFEYVDDYIPRLYNLKMQGFTDPLHLLDLCADVVYYLIAHKLTDEDIHELWEIWSKKPLESRS